MTGTPRGPLPRRALALALFLAPLVVAAAAPARDVPSAGPPPRPVQARDVASRMARAEDLLRDGRLGAETAALQDDILDLIDALIAFHQDAGGAPATQAVAARDGAGVQVQGQATGRPEAPAEESRLPSGAGPGGFRLDDQSVEGDWAPALPERERVAVFDAFRTGRLPQRYRSMLRAYSTRLAADGSGREG